MAVRSWLDGFRARLQGKQARRIRKTNPLASHLRSVENLQQRTMLTSQVLLLGNPALNDGHLQILTDADEDVVVQEDPSNTSFVQVLVNGSPAPGQPTIQALALSQITVITGDADNSVDVSGVTSAVFTNLTSLTIDTGNGHDSIVGSDDFAENINAGDGNDTVNGAGNDDTILGDDGNDVITGGDGNDVINAGDGADFVTGDAGNDSIEGDDGNDTISGGDGDDTAMAGDGSDVVTGELGNDSLFGDLGDDTIDGGDGNDSLFGGGQDDSINGNLGDDFILANGGNDIVSADDGDDFARGGSGNDSVLGGNGTDELIGDNGNDTVIGNDGNDTIRGGGGNDSLLGDGADSLATETGDDQIFGNSGNDTIIGVMGADILDGGAGDDLVRSAFEVVAAEVPSPPPVPIPPPPSPGTGASILDDAVDSGGGTDTGSSTANLTNGPGDATVDVTLNAVGEFGRASDSPGVTDADYDPVGPLLPAGTTFESYVFYRAATTGPRQELFQAATNISTIRSTGTEANSTFQIGNLNFALVQLLEPIDDSSGMQNGTLLTQTYTITNTGAAPESFELLRYLDGDLDFDGTLIDGGGRLVTANNEEILFETDAGGTDSTDTTFVGITGFGGTIPATGRFDLAEYFPFSALESRPNQLRNGTALIDTIVNDGDGDEFVDAGLEYDVTLNLQNDFAIPAGMSAVYTTHTLFGSGPPNQAIVNNGPTAVDDSGSFAVGTSTSITLDIVSNDSDADGALDFSTISITTPPTNGTAVSLGNGLVTYTPNPGFTGTDTFDYTIDDNTGATSNVATVTITVVNPDPVGDTLMGSDGNDTLIGLTGDDFFDGGLNNDTIMGLGGNDTIYGGGGNDSIDGGEGSDSLTGNGGSDTLDGGAGDDTLNWRPDKDSNVTVIGSDGGDTVAIQGNSGANSLTLGENADGQMTVTQGTAVLTVDATNEVINLNSGAGSDSITIGNVGSLGLVSLSVDGGAGNDVIDASGATIGSFTLFELNGGDGNDTITGSSSAEVINGDADDDSLVAGGGNDTINGGTGNDVIDGQDGDDTADGGDGNDTIRGGDGDDSLAGGNDQDSIDGQDGNDTLDGGFGDDNLLGNRGDDSAMGGFGSDTLIGAAGNDTLDGGRNDDFLHGNSGDDKLRGDHGNDSLVGLFGNDELVGGDGDDTLFGGTGNDGISGGDGNDFLQGDQGGDTIVGGDGSDSMVGGGGNDILLGEQGDDSLNGSGGTDIGNSGEGDNAPEVNIETIDNMFTLTANMMANIDGI